MSIFPLYPFVYLKSMYKPDKDTIWLLRGSQRKLVFLNLPKDAFMSNKLRKELNETLKTSLSLREMSRHLRDFDSQRFFSFWKKDELLKLFDKKFDLVEFGEAKLGHTNFLQFFFRKND